MNFDVDIFDEDDDILAQAIDETVEDMQSKRPEDISTSYGLEKPKDASEEECLPLVPHSTPLESLPGFDVDAGRTWVYPINYPMRKYQYSIVEKALFRNTLVSLPTGLGKTFIAAVVMYNFYRWYPRSKIVFMAPTKPLVAQQIEACFNIVGMPQEDTSQLTGTMVPERRVQSWADKRVFFLTPQVLTNDLSRGACPATLIKCLVLDEAHRGLGNHAYCQVVRRLREYRHDFRILALSATPGSDLQAVRQVITNLMISHIELRSEDNPDIKDYIHHRTIDKIVVPLGEELTRLKARYLSVLRVYVNKLIDMKVLFTRDETTLSKFQILQARDAFRQNPPESLPSKMFGVVEGLFALCMTLYHSYELMLQHGTKSFYKFLKDTLHGDRGHSLARSELLRNKVFQDLMEELAEKFDPKSSLSQTSKHHSSQIFSEIGCPHPQGINHDLPYVISHPKIAKLLSIVIDHHQKFADEGSSTKIMIFSQYRDSVLEITELLQYYHPLVKAMSFIGQSSVARGGRGFSQKEQLKVVKQFREGGFNTLISTCVGEEGLDIGEVDLIICYDAPKSPIRLVQRMGRTGRKREGRIVVLVTKGKEEQMYNHSQYQKKSINAALADKKKLTQFLNPSSPRMIPRGMTPVCIKLHMKVGTWKVPTGRGRKSSIDCGTSVSSLVCSFNSSSSNRRKNHVKQVGLSKEEWAWWRENLYVPTQEIKTLPQPSLTCIGSHDSEKDSISVSNIDLGIYQPWQTIAQTTNVICHSSRTLHLVQLAEFIGLQYHFDPGDDPYGLEMASFLDMAYVEGNDVKKASLFTSVKHDESRDAQHTLTLHKSVTNKTGTGRKNSCASKGKKTKKPVQSSLITSMLIQRPRQVEKEKFGKCQDLVDFDIGNIEKTEEKSISEDSDVEVIEDSVLKCNVNGNTDLKYHHQVVASPHKGIEDTVSDLTKKTELGNQHDLNNVKSPSKGDSQIHSQMLELLTLLPTRQQSPLHIRTPPSEVDFSCDTHETTAPASPSDIILVVNDWMEKKEKETERFFCRSRGSAFDDSVDTPLPTYINHNSETDLPNLCGMQEGNTYEVSSKPQIKVDATPVLENKVTTEACKTEKVEATSNTGEIQPQNVTPQKMFSFASTSLDADISPILSSTYKKPVQTNLKLYFSTPKVNAKRLFKVETPDTTAIRQCSPVSRKVECFSSCAKLCSDDIKEVKSNYLERGEPQTISHPLVSQRSKVRSKLSMFTAPEKLEFTSDTEPTSAQRSNTYIKSYLMETDITDQKKKGTGVVIEKSVMEEDAEDILMNGKRHHRLQDTENLKKGRNLTDLSLQEISAEINAAEDANNESVMKYSDKNNFKENSVVICSPPKQKSNVIVGTNETSKLCSSEEFHFTNRTDMAADLKTKRGSVSNEVNKPFTLDSSKQCCVNFSLTLDDHLFAELEVKQPQEAEISAPAQLSLGSVKNYASNKNQRSCTSSNSVSLLGVTQILDLVDKTAVDEHAMEGSDKNLSFSKNCLNNTLVSSGNSPYSLFSKPGKSHCNFDKNHTNEILISKNETNSTERGTETNNASHLPCKIDATSLETLKQMKDFSKPNFSLLDDILSDGENRPEEEENQQSSAEHSVQFELLGSDEFEPMSESLLANVEVNTKMEGHQRRQIPEKEEKGNESPDHRLKNEGHSFTVNKICNVVSKKKENLQIGGQAQDVVSGNSSLRLGVNNSSILPSPNTQVWKRGKRKLCTVVESDTDLSTNSENVVLRKSANSMSDKSHSFGNKDSMCKKKKKLEVEFNLNDDDDDFQCDSALFYQEVKEKLENKVNKKPRRWKRKNQFIEEEAEVSEDGVSVSSDESDAVKEEYDYSFVDDCSQKSQDAGVDMKAVYLQSVISPFKKNQLDHRQYRPLPHLSNTPESTEELDETDEDSFVVDNNFVEYDTEYLGDTMLAEDPIMIQALHDKASAKKAKDNKKGSKGKRKRIIMLDSSSDDESVYEKKINDMELLKLKSDDVCKSDVESDKAKEKSFGANNPSIIKIVAPSDNVQSRDQKRTKLTKEVIPRLSPNEDYAEMSESFELEQSLHDRVTTKKANDTRIGSHYRRKKSFHDLSSEESVVENKKMKSNPPLCGLKSNDSVKPGIQSIKEKSLEASKSSALSGKDHRSTNVTKEVIPKLSTAEDKPVFSEASKSEVTTVILVDSFEIAGGGNIVSKLRNHYGVCTSVVQVAHAHYAVSTRMAVSRLLHSVFSSSQQRTKLVQRVQGMLDLYDRPVIIVEMDHIRMGESPCTRKTRSRYLDTITCACTQVTQLKVLYSGGQEETTFLLWQLAEQEKAKGYRIPVLPEHITEVQQVVNFYRSLPRINYATAVCLAHNFRTVKEMVNSSVGVIQEKGCISVHRATAIKQYLSRVFKPDMLPP